ncbi:hypothetical protein [Rhodanobacter umsongensis]
MSFAIDLVLFEPARHVIYGMPVFTSTDAELLRYMLMNHGEWGDNTTHWHAGYVADGMHLQLLCQLHTAEGPIYRSRLVPCLAHIAYPWTQQDDGIRFKLPAFWYAHRRAPAEPVIATTRNPMSRLKGNWFPCDGAIALDVSALPATCHRRLPGFFHALMLDQPDLMECWRARAEYCFLLRLQPPTEEQYPSIKIRETPFHNRQAALVDMRLPISKTLLENITA